MNLLNLILALLIATISNHEIIECEARGGRGRGGGSFGGLFGGWRKYKSRSQSVGNSRRIQNGSPMHTSLTLKDTQSSSLLTSSAKSSKLLFTSYPKKQMGYTGGYGGAPSGGNYYPNSGALPAGAIYYTKPPPRSSNGDFLVGMVTGHMMSNILYRPRHHMMRPHETDNITNSDNRGDHIIIINTGDAIASPTNQTESENLPDLIVTQSKSSEQDESSSESTEYNSTSTEIELPPAQYGIVCFPMMLNETDPNDPDLIKEVERTVCFPAQQPPPTDCVIRSSIETDPNDPKQTIEVDHQECSYPTATVPPVVVGDIGDQIANIDVQS